MEVQGALCAKERCKKNQEGWIQTPTAAWRSPLLPHGTPSCCYFWGERCAIAQLHQCSQVLLNSLLVCGRCCCTCSLMVWITRTGHRWSRMTFRATWRGWGAGWWPWKVTQRDARCCRCHCVWRGHKLKILSSGQHLITVVTKLHPSNLYSFFIAPYNELIHCRTWQRLDKI